MNFDLAVIGGGPAGYNAAEKAAVNGFNTVLFEKEAIGGVCLNEGCIPTKTLLYSAKLLDQAKSASKYGILIEGETGFDLDKIISRKNKTVKRLTGGVRMKLKANGVTVVEGFVTLSGEEDGLIRLVCGDEVYFSKYILLCTGSETVIPPIKGLADTSYWTSREALEMKELPRTLTIIGGGVIGMEFASFFHSMGVKVRVVEMLPEILGNMDKEMSLMLRNEYSKKGVEFHLGTKVIEVNDHQVLVEKEGTVTTLDTEKILVSVGRKASVSNIGLESLHIELLKNGVKVNEFMQTSHPQVYACGDVTGYSMLAHTAMREGEVAVNHLTGLEDRMSYNAIPAVVYTNPEFAGIGKTEEELLENGTSYRVLKLPMSYSGRFVAENELGNGLCKLILDEDDVLVGCHLLGNPASELIPIAGMAIEKRLSVEEFRKIVFPHPTVAEIFHESLNL